MNTNINERVKSKNLEEVWKWKDTLSEDMRGKSFEEVRRILDKGMQNYSDIIKME
ncbi:MAG: hypothetical protein JXJ04_05970 [Spirochaetales bacterium]|nr:hypothetical protein [Spirochaetales bacterium]